MSDLVERLREPDWHDPKCPFPKYCYCYEDGELPPHDRVRHPLALEAADRIAALEAENQRLKDEEGSHLNKLLYGICADYNRKLEKVSHTDIASDEYKKGFDAGTGMGGFILHAIYRELIAPYIQKSFERIEAEQALAQQEGV